MTLLATGRCVGNSMNWSQGEPTIAEMLSDSTVLAVMKADGVDPVELEALSRSMVRNSAALRQEAALR